MHSEHKATPAKNRAVDLCYFSSAKFLGEIKNCKAVLPH